MCVWVYSSATLQKLYDESVNKINFTPPAYDESIKYCYIMGTDSTSSASFQTSEHVKSDFNDLTVERSCEGLQSWQASSMHLQKYAGRRIDVRVLCESHECRKSTRHWTLNTRHIPDGCGARMDPYSVWKKCAQGSSFGLWSFVIPSQEFRCVFFLFQLLTPDSDKADCKEQTQTPRASMKLRSKAMFGWATLTLSCWTEHLENMFPIPVNSMFSLGKM